MRTNSSPLPTVVSYITLDEIIAAARRKSPDFRPGSIPTRHHYHRQIKVKDIQITVTHFIIVGWWKIANISRWYRIYRSSHRFRRRSDDYKWWAAECDWRFWRSWSSCSVRIHCINLIYFWSIWRQVRPPKDAFSNPIIHDADPLRMLLLAERKAAKHHHYRDVHLDDDNEDELLLIRDDDDDDRMSAGK